VHSSQSNLRHKMKGAKWFGRPAENSGMPTPPLGAIGASTLAPLALHWQMQFPNAIPGSAYDSVSDLLNEDYYYYVGLGFICVFCSGLTFCISCFYCVELCFFKRLAVKMSLR